MRISQILQKARREAKLTQSDLATRAGTSQPAVARYEAETAIPTIPTLERLLAACGQQLQISVSRSTSAPPSSIRGRTEEQAALLRSKRKPLLAAAQRRGVRNVRVFGSVARGDARPDSDIDLLVEFGPGRSLLDIAGFRNDARKILNRDVDVATPEILREEFRDDVLAEAVLL
jgi:predicted nucleotidyltransferase/DNA-binding XRE family transcriptional regulator